MQSILREWTVEEVDKTIRGEWHPQSQQQPSEQLSNEQLVIIRTAALIQESGSESRQIPNANENENGNLKISTHRAVLLLRAFDPQGHSHSHSHIHPAASIMNLGYPRRSCENRKGSGRSVLQSSLIYAAVALCSLRSALLCWWHRLPTWNYTLSSCQHMRHCIRGSSRISVSQFASLANLGGSRTTVLE